MWWKHQVFWKVRIIREKNVFCKIIVLKCYVKRNTSFGQASPMMPPRPSNWYSFNSLWHKFKLFFQPLHHPNWRQTGRRTAQTAVKLKLYSTKQLNICHSVDRRDAKNVCGWGKGIAGAATSEYFGKRRQSLVFYLSFWTRIVCVLHRRVYFIGSRAKAQFPDHPIKYVFLPFLG